MPDYLLQSFILLRCFQMKPFLKLDCQDHSHKDEVKHENERNVNVSVEILLDDHYSPLVSRLLFVVPYCLSNSERTDQKDTTREDNEGDV